MAARFLEENLRQYGIFLCCLGIAALWLIAAAGGGARAAEPLRIGVPGDPVNTGRALLLLQSMGLLKLRASSTT